MSSRLYGMVKERDYLGGPDHFRHLIAEHRPRKAVEAFLRLKTLPGEQGQVDWGQILTDHHWTGQTPFNGLCDGAELESTNLFTFLSEPADQ